jgi:3-oxoacyl-[acyl-carrier-protein] synthase II
VTGTARHRVAVVGTGVVAPGAPDAASFWTMLRAGESQAGPVRAFDASGLPVTFACEATDFDASEHLDQRTVKQTDRVTHLGVAAGLAAVADAGEVRVPRERRAVLTGVGLGGLGSFTRQAEIDRASGWRAMSSFGVSMLMPNATAGRLAMRLGWTGPNFDVATACASGSHAIGEGARLIREGSADVVLAGGAEAVVTDIALKGFARMQALSRNNDDPRRASRPFDKDRDGFVLGEGAAFLVLERWDHAVARGAAILGELVGYGRNSDAHHIAAPHPEGTGVAECMRLALDDCALDPSAVDHVVAHGTSTQLNDAAEAIAIAKVFGTATKPVTSIKGHIGHLIGAAGAASAVTAVLSLRHSTAVPTANYTTPDPDLPVRVLTDAEPVAEPAVLVNAFGFGGHNASLVFANPQEGS